MEKKQENGERGGKASGRTRKEAAKNRVGCTLLARSILYELYVLSAMACFTLVRTELTLIPSRPFSLNQTLSSLPMMASLLTPAPLLPLLFTHQITSYGTWTFLPLALRLAMHSARFELTLALRQEVPKPSYFQVTPDLFHWQGHLLDGVRVTLSFGVGCLELASDKFVYVRFPYPEPGHAPTLTPDCGSYFFSRASHSLGHLHPSRPGVVDPSEYARPASLLKWPDTSPATRSRYAHLPHHDTPDAPPKLLPTASIPYYHMGMDQLCQPAVLHDKELVPSLWLAAFAALIGTTLTNEHNALLQHPLIPHLNRLRAHLPLRKLNHSESTSFSLACSVF